MNNIDKIKIFPNSTIKEALSIIDKGALKIAVVVDSSDRVIGTISDGDIRRGILRGYTIDDTIEDLYHKDPFLAKKSDKKEHIVKKAIQRKLYQVPIVNDDNVLIDIIDLATLLDIKKRGNKVILMAGGLGTRLRPLTEETPKPLLKVGDKPILQTIIENFRQFGFDDIVISVNYKADMIKEYFGDGKKFDVNISYIDEDKRLGTAGALGLLSKDRKPKEPFFVMNGDILTSVNFEKFLDFFIEQNSFASMAVRQEKFQVPYGVVETKSNNIISIKEKPIYNFFVNGGIYLLSHKVLDLIEPNVYLDMPELFEKLINKGYSISSFPIHEYWLDIGRMEEFKKAQSEYFGVFNV